MKQSITVKDIGVGALAGASLMLVLMVFTTVMLLAGALWQYLFNSQIPVIRDFAGIAVMEDIGRLPEFLWGWRWLLLGMIVTGGTLALIERAVQRYPASWRNQIVIAVVFLVIGTLLITWQLLNIEEALFAGADQSDSLATLAQRRANTWNQIGLSMVLALAAAGVVWAGWMWWYNGLRHWLGLDRRAHVEAPQKTANDWFAQRQAHDQARRVLAVALLVSGVALIAATSAYEPARHLVQSGTIRAEADQPAGGVRMLLTRPERTLLIENTYGIGAVTLTLLSERDGQPTGVATTIRFRDTRVSFERSPLDVAHLPQGGYVLNAELSEGAGGRVSYALIQTNGIMLPILAVLVGLCSSAVLALAVMLIRTFIPEAARE